MLSGRHRMPHALLVMYLRPTLVTQATAQGLAVQPFPQSTFRGTGAGRLTFVRSLQWEQW